MSKMNFIKSIPPKWMRDNLGMYQAGENRLGWHGEMDRCWTDFDSNIQVCSRLIRTKFGNVEHVTITKGDEEVTWSEKMQIKNELFGENRFAIEIFPKQKNLVDVCNVYHLWVFDKKLEMPFGIAPKEYQKAINRGYSLTNNDINIMIDSYKKLQ